MSARRKIHRDVVVVGGGVAALWTANALKAAGRSVLVLVEGSLGCRGATVGGSCQV